jgi:hypothetical protein
MVSFDGTGKLAWLMEWDQGRLEESRKAELICLLDGVAQIKIDSVQSDEDIEISLLQSQGANLGLVPHRLKALAIYARGVHAALFLCSYH